jgi:hypothetical protein
MNRSPLWALALVAAMLLLQAACAATDSQALLGETTREAASGGLSPCDLRGGEFTLAGFARPGPGSALTVYIEGDGRAWATRARPSDDPTPREPLTLRLALRDPAPKLLYLARPCQYLAKDQPAGACESSLWTEARYGPKVVDALNQALDEAKERLHAETLSLVGYSGGGVLAMLLAAGRHDVTDVLTVGANLDIRAWAAYHGVSGLAGSLNPADQGPAMAQIWQTHLVGAADTICPPWLCERYLDRIGRPKRARCLVVEGADHREGLVRRWPELLSMHREFVGEKEAAGLDLTGSR